MPRDTPQLPNTETIGTTDGLPCANKIAFANQQQAQAAAAADAYYHGSRLRAYRCRYCSAWHLSSQPTD